MKFTKHFSENAEPIVYVPRDSVIKNPDGSVVSETKGAMVPKDWSQLATDIVTSKYFRKAGLYGDSDKGEKHVESLVHRIANTIKEEGETAGYFATPADAEAFESELKYILLTQRAAFNSPVWFNCGLYQQYGIEGSGGNYAWDPVNKVVVETENAYENPQCSACFIQKAEDDLMKIYDLIKNEARLFKYGSGTGTNFSAIRGRQEKISGGGTSSGLLSFLEVLDKGAGATKSGGTTRRAAKMVCLDVDHPEIVDFIQWKTREEKKARALIEAGFSSAFEGEAYRTVSGQNSNNSIRVTDEFMHAVIDDYEWETTMRTTGEVVNTYKARDLWDMMAESAWQCADPGVQYDTTINHWHTCENSGRINASNPCSEYMFLDNSACNLASINLIKYLDDEGNFDVEGFKHTVRILITAQDILVDYSSYPTKEIAQNSHDFRPLGLGYANLGTLIMRLGLPYDSAEGRDLCRAITALMGGEAYKTSAELASWLEPFAGYKDNRFPMLEVIALHMDEASCIKLYSPLTVGQHKDLIVESEKVWIDALKYGEKYGYRNSQTTVLAPTGTIGLLMDCDTTGIEPEFALVKFKKLAGGGSFKIVNNSVPAALKRLGYSESEIKAIIDYVLGTCDLSKAPYINHNMLLSKGLSLTDIRKVEDALPSVFHISQAFSQQVLGSEVYRRLTGLMPDGSTDVLRNIGLTPKQIEELNAAVVGHMTIEGAPHIRPEHLPVFDCANRCGETGTRFIEPRAHLEMMAAAQPFLSGAISKTVNLPNEATVEDIKDLYMKGWELGLKAVALYRDGCKSSQPLNTSSKEKKKEETVQTTETVHEEGNPAPQIVNAGMCPPPTVRHRLPNRRHGFTQSSKVAGHKIFIRTGEYADGSLGEVFIDMHKEGAAFRSLMNCFAISVSMGLQHGVPLESYINQFTFTRFEPQGMVEGHPNIKMATSMIDYVFRVLGVEYAKRYDLAHIAPKEIPEELDTSKQPEVEQSPTNAPEVPAPTGDSVSAHLSSMMGDAPMCDVCGHITVRNGSCYKCINCGASMGCS